MQVRQEIGGLLDLIVLFDPGAAFSIGTVSFNSWNPCMKDYFCERWEDRGGLWIVAIRASLMFFEGAFPAQAHHLG